MLTIGSSRSLEWEMRGRWREPRQCSIWELGRRNGSRLPWGYLLWKDGLWAQMKNWLNSDRLVSNQSLGPSVKWLCQGADVGVKTLKVWGDHVTCCWQCVGRQYFAHIPMLPVGGHLVTKPSSQMLLSVEGSVYSPLTCNLEQSGNCTKLIGQIKPLAGHNSTNPLSFNWLYHVIYSHTQNWYIFEIFIWVIDRYLIKLKVSFMFTCYKQMKEKPVVHQYHIHHSLVMFLHPNV